MWLVIILISGTAGFVFLALFDLSQVYRSRPFTTVFSILGYLGVFSSVLFMVFTLPPENMRFSPAFIILLLFAALFLGLLLYVLFFAIGKGASPDTEGGFRHAVDSGFYGIVRHPGFYFFSLFLLMMAFAFRSRAFWTFCGYLIFLDLVLIILEDLLFFPKIFVNYGKYKKKVAFLIPGVL